MTFAQPPRIATWLLHVSGVDDALIGDLNEAYNGGRSTMWYWRQTLRDATTVVWHSMMMHKVTMIRATVTGWIALSLCAAIGAGITSLLGRWTWTGGADTWMDIPAAMIYRAPLLVIMCIGGAAGGRLIARLHRSERTSVVCAFALIPVLMSIVWLARTIEMLPWASHQGLMNSLFVATGLVTATLSILAGGFWHLPNQNDIGR
jgi:hypothetical protein